MQRKGSETLVVVIPAYQPTESLVKIVEQIKEFTDYTVLVVNDGSDKECNKYFDKIKNISIVLHHKANFGKGTALKTALSFIKHNFENTDYIVTADADGQHLIGDIIQIAETARRNPGKLILGSRDFNDKKVPFKSKFGNKLTHYIFTSASGVSIEDTQTGLRAFPAEWIGEMAKIEGVKYEYEMNTLFWATKNGHGIIEHPISTVYISNNIATHYSPFRDSFKIFLVIAKFAISSFASFLIDYFLFLIFTGLTADATATVSTFVSTYSARAVSSTCNFLINKNMVFENKENSKQCLIKYYIVVVGIMIINPLIQLFYNQVLFIPTAIAKLITELTCFPINYIMQRKFVFKPATKGKI